MQFFSHHRVSLVFHKLHINENTVGVPNNLYKMYLKDISQSMLHASVCIKIRKNNVSKVFLSCLEVEQFFLH